MKTTLKWLKLAVVLASILRLPLPAATAQPGNLDPNFNIGAGPNNLVYAVALQADGRILMGGEFTSIGGTDRLRLARLNTDGTLDVGYNAGAGVNGYVSSLIPLSDGKAIIGGSFTSVGGTNRNYIARVNPDGSVDASFDPGSGFNGVVLGMAPQPDGKVVVGGQFSSCNGVSRAYLARLHANGSLDAAFMPTGGFNGYVNRVAVQPDGKILAAGSFSTVNGVYRNYLARLNSDGSLDTSFDPGTGPNSPVNGLVLQPDGRVLIGGTFTAVNGVSGGYLARLETNGLVDVDFAASANNLVYALVPQSDGRVVVAGAFTTMNGQNLNRVARLRADGSLDPSFDPGLGFNQTVRAVAAQADGQLVLVGDFTQFNGASQNYVARLAGVSSASGGELGFSAANYRVLESGSVTSIEVRRTGNRSGSVTVAYATSNGTANAGNYTPQSGTLVFAANETSKTFTIPIRRNNLAEDDRTVNLTLSNPTGGAVLGAQPTAVLTVVNVDKNTNPGGLDIAFRGGLNNQVTAITVGTDGKILLGGDFSVAGGVNAQRIARLNADATVDPDFSPGTWFNDRINRITLQPDGKLVCGGRFTTVNGITRNRLARLNLDGTLDPMFDPGAGPNGEVFRVIYLPDDTMLIAGAFTAVGGVNVSGVARLYVDGTLDRTFKIGGGVNATVYAMDVQADGKIVIGGNFSAVNGVPRNYLARLDPDGAVDLTFDPGSGPNNYVNNVVAQVDGKMLITGVFGAVNGLSRPYIARLAADGLADASFDTGGGPNSYVYCLAAQADGRIFMGGEFTAFDGHPINRLARLRADGSLDPSFDPGTGANAMVGAVTLEADGNLLAGGNFTQFNGFNRAYLVRAIGVNHAAGGEIAFASGAYTVSESQPLATVQVQRAGSTGNKVTVSYFTGNGTANAGNYTPQSGSLVFGPGETAKTFTIPIHNNNLVEEDKTVNLTLTNATGGAMIGSQNTAVLTLINDDTYTNLGGLDATFRAGLNAQVMAAAVQPDGNLVVAGDFSVAGGQNRLRLARLTPSGEVDPGFYGAAYANDRVNTIVVQADGKLLLAGRFTVVNGVARNRVARLNPDGSLDGLLDPGNGPNSEVHEMLAQADDTLLIAGSFTSVNGVPQNYLARLYTDGTLDPTFNFGDGANSAILALAAQADGRILIGGQFTTVNGVLRNYVARLQADGSVDLTFDPGAGPNSAVYAIAAPRAGNVLIGGAFTQVNGIARPYLARLNADGLVDLDFDTGAGFNSPIFAILAQPDGKVVVGGSFTAFDGQSMNRLARLRVDGSWDASFDVGAGATDTINTLVAQTDGKLLAGGNFARFNNLSRGYLARVLGANNAARGELAFGAGAYRVMENQPLATIEVRRTGSLAGTVTVAFATSNGTATAGYYTPQSGTLVFAPNETSKTFTVPVKNNNLVEDDKTVNLTLSNPSGGGVLGSQRTALLTIVNDDNNTAVGAIDASFQAGVNGYVGGVGVLPDGRVVIAGNFSTAGGGNRMRLALLNPLGGVDAGFYAGAWINDQINALVVQNDGKIVIAGRFTLVDGLTRNRLARFLPDGTLDTSFDPGSGPNGEVYALASLSDGSVYIGGAFNNVAGVARNGFARLYTDASLDRTHDIGGGFNGSVYAFVVQSDGKAVAVGNFTQVNGIPRNRLARLNPDGSVDATFDTGDGLNNEGYALALQTDGKVVVGGAFTKAGSLDRNYLARFNPTGVADSSFDPGSGPNAYVRSLAVQPDGLILIGGSFTSYHGEPQNHLARLLATGALDPGFAIGSGPNHTVLRIVLAANGLALIGGDFTQYNGLTRQYLARLIGAPLPPTLRFLAAVRRADGQVRLTLSGQAGQTYIMQASEDLRTWGSLATNTAPAENFDWTDTTAGNAPRRFYRAICRP